MKLVCFSLKHYRSIRKAYKVRLSDYNVIVGPNNEGKSNILKALSFCLSLSLGRHIKKRRLLGARRYRYNEDIDYVWTRDYPVDMQKSKPNGKSEFTLEFELSTQELDEFHKKIRNKLNSNLKIRISIDSDNAKFDIIIHGKASKSLNNKIEQILKHINEKLYVQYIPSIRTFEMANQIVNDLLSKELSVLDGNSEIQEHLKAIKKLQEPLITKINKTLSKTIQKFIPEVKKVDINYRGSYSRLMSTWCQIHIDDGINTDIKLKGDGIISLVAISLFQHLSTEGAYDKDLILLIEEPESHLHPDSIHNLKSVLNEISHNSQVIITTHSPIMIDRTVIENNLIVHKRNLYPAKDMKCIRDILGVTISDNLSSAKLILLVEGEEDVKILESWLMEMSERISESIKNGVFALVHLCGATNLAYNAGLYKTQLCDTIAYMDNDESGRKAVKQAIDIGRLQENEYVLSKCQGMNNSEIEDLITYDTYFEYIHEHYGVNLDDHIFRNNKSVWSDRLKIVFSKYGKLWNKTIEMQIKYKISNLVQKKGINSLNEQRKDSILSLIKTIEKAL